jgi:hypothetical protein
MLEILKFFLIAMIPFILFILLLNYHYKKKYADLVYKAKKLGVEEKDLPNLFKLSLWKSTNTQSVFFMSILVLLFSLLFQAGNNELKNVTVENLPSGEYNLVSTNINGEGYNLLENSSSKIIVLETGDWIKWSKNKNCNFVLYREKNVKTPYVKIQVERVGNFWEDAIIDVYRVEMMEVFLAEDSQIFDYSGIEDQVTIYSNYH